MSKRVKKKSEFESLIKQISHSGPQEDFDFLATMFEEKLSHYGDDLRPPFRQTVAFDALDIAWIDALKKVTKEPKHRIIAWLLRAAIRELLNALPERSMKLIKTEYESCLKKRLQQQDKKNESKKNRK